MQIFSAIFFLFFLLPSAPCVIFRSLQHTDPGNQSHEGFFCLQILVDVKSGGRGASLQMFFRVHFPPVAIPTKETRKRKKKRKGKEDLINTLLSKTGQAARGPNYSLL
jgi:hypothetical protein